MALENLKPTAGSTHAKRIVGRGYGSFGKTAGRGQKGQGSRKSGGVRLGFAGGQTPLYKRIAKRGFTHVFKTQYEIVNVHMLNIFEEGEVVDRASLVAKGLIDKNNNPVKILGDGELNNKVIVKVDKVSAQAKAKIEAAGGKVEEL